MIPWYLKIAAKLVLSRSGIPRSVMNRLGVFRHGSMVRPGYALEIVRRHLAVASEKVAHRRLVELGPGDSVGNGIIAFAMGASGSYLVDEGDWATRSMPVYQDFIRWLIAAVPEFDKLQYVIDEATSFSELLEACGIVYMTEGQKSLAEIPSATVDYSFSEAVLEHIRVADFAETIDQLGRITCPGGVGTHVVDFKDHLQAGLNNMRFPEWLWEKPWFARNSGFYTNRLRYPDVVRYFDAAGFDLIAARPVSWPRLPMPSGSIHPSLQRYDDEALRISEATFLVRRRAGPDLAKRNLRER